MIEKNVKKSGAGIAEELESEFELQPKVETGDFFHDNLDPRLKIRSEKTPQSLAPPAPTPAAAPEGQC
jgi:hypothetical protein